MRERIDLTYGRIRLRSTVYEDGPALVSIRRTEEVRRRWRGDELEAQFAEELDDDEVFRLTIETGRQIIGLAQFAKEQDEDYRHASVDIYIDPAVHRRGYATEALRTLVDYLFDERRHHRLTIDPAADNHPAIECYSRPVGRRSGKAPASITVMVASDPATRPHPGLILPGLRGKATCGCR